MIKILRADKRHRRAINEIIRRNKIGDRVGAVKDLWFVRQRGRIIACCGLAMHNGNVAVLTSLAVEKEFRGKGIGRALFKKYETTARLRGAEQLALCTFFRTRSFKIYQRYGFKKQKRADLPENIRSYWQFRSKRFLWCLVMIRDA